MRRTLLIHSLLLVAGSLLGAAVGFRCGQHCAENGQIETVVTTRRVLPSSRSSSNTQEFLVEELIRVVNEPGSPFAYDNKTGEFYVENTLQNRPSYILRFDPFSGSPLVSARVRLFADVPPDEAARLYDMIAGADNLSDIVSQIGKPDISYAKTEYWRASHVWSNLSDVATLLVIESLDGALQPSVVPKQVRESVTSR